MKNIQTLILRGGDIVALDKQNEALINENEKQIAELKEQIKNLQKQNKELQIKKDIIRNEIIECILESGNKSVNIGGYKFTAKKNPGKVIVKDQFEIPEKYIKEEVVEKIDKKHIKEDFKKFGILPSGCEIEQTYSLLITEKEAEKLNHDNNIKIYEEEEEEEIEL